MSVTNIWQLLRETFSEWNEDKAPRLAAALAFYAMTSIAPLLIIVIALAGLIFDAKQVRSQVNTQIVSLVGSEGAEAIDGIVRGSEGKSSGILATVIGLATLLLAAGGFFGQLQDALNTIWEVAPKPGRSFWQIVRDRFTPFTMVLGVGFLLLVSLVVSAMLTAAGSFLIGESFESLWIWQVVNFVVSLGISTLLFAMIYKVLPDVKLAWRDVWVGALITSVLFAIGRFLISLYLGYAAPESAYGAAGSLVIVLIWIFYSAQILFFGAEFTQVYARKYGSQVKPTENAVALTEQDRAQQGIARPEQVEQAARGTGPRRALRPGQAASAQPIERGLAGKIVGAVLGSFVVAALFRRGKARDR
jgi:membrane protein